MKNLPSYILFVIALLVTVDTFANTQEVVTKEENYYKGYKIPPMEIPATTKYTHEYIDILGSKMAYIDIG